MKTNDNELIVHYAKKIKTCHYKEKDVLNDTILDAVQHQWDL